MKLIIEAILGAVETPLLQILTALREIVKSWESLTEVQETGLPLHGATSCLLTPGKLCSQATHPIYLGFCGKILYERLQHAAPPF